MNGMMAWFEIGGIKQVSEPFRMLKYVLLSVIKSLICQDRRS